MPGIGGGPGGPPAMYDNPFRQIRGLTPERIDMGVDYAGSGPIFALGPGVIVAVNYAWSGGVGAVGPGTWIVEKLTDGPMAGHFVYVAENVTPAASVGDHVAANTVIAIMTGQGAGIETGIAADSSSGLYGQTLAAQYQQQAQGHDPGAWSTSAGAAYSKILEAVGCVPGIMSPGGPHGLNPPWLTKIVPDVTGSLNPGIFTDGLGADAAVLDAAATALARQAQHMVDVGTSIMAIGRAGWTP